MPEFHSKNTYKNNIFKNKKKNKKKITYNYVKIIIEKSTIIKSYIYDLLKYKTCRRILGNMFIRNQMDGFFQEPERAKNLYVSENRDTDKQKGNEDTSYNIELKCHPIIRFHKE